MKIIFSLLLVAASARAVDDAIVSKYRNSGIRVLTEAKKNGRSEIDGVVIDEVIDYIRSIKIQHSGLQVYKAGRRCAAWQNVSAIADPKYNMMENYISLNKNCDHVQSIEVAGIMVHEAIGAKLKSDRNYEISSELLMKSSTSPINNLKDEQKINSISEKNRNHKMYLLRGGSTLVGGGGDSDDLSFKVIGLNYLNTFPDQFSLYGIPIGLLKKSIKYMKTAPSSSIDTFLELRQAGVESSRQDSVIYVDSEIYRGKDIKRIEMLAVMAARLYLLYSPDDLNLAETNDDIATTRTWISTLIEVPYLVFPIDHKKVIIWENPELSALMSEQQSEDYITAATKTALDINNSLFNSLVSSKVWIRANGAVKEFR